jgi:hypothetical protein
MKASARARWLAWREHVMKMIAKRHETPGAANECLKMIRRLARFAILLEWRTDDPTLEVEGYGEGEWHSWNDAEIEAYQAHWPVGTAARTAFALLLYTGQRLSDVRQMTWADAANGRVQVVQEKTGAQLSIPIHPELARALSGAQPAPSDDPDDAVRQAVLGQGVRQPDGEMDRGCWPARRMRDARHPEGGGAALGRGGLYGEGDCFDHRPYDAEGGRAVHESGEPIEAGGSGDGAA